MACTVASLGHFPSADAATPDTLFADFESADYAGWSAEGTAFGSGPAHGTLPGQMSVSGFRGQGLVNSFLGGDASQGTLTSPAFTVRHAFISFLIGGGGFEQKTCMNLLVDGREVRTATGPNTLSGGSEALVPSHWNVSEFLGRQAQLQIVDHATGGWGHINVDHIVFTDVKPPGVLTNATREFFVNRRYLQLPVKTGAKVRRLAVLVDGKVVRECDIELADGPESWWAPMDLEPWKGKQAVVRVDRLPENSSALTRMGLSDRIRGAEPLYTEPLRPQFHFSPRRGWNNDPNGLVFADGEYHLFYQNNPYGWNWGNMHWAHAVSEDLLHWKELPIALYPKQYGDWVFSGSAVVDGSNTSGWKQGTASLLVAAYTSTGRGECIVFSNDRGRTWTEFEGNPVVKHEGRDPRLLWYAPGQHWVMALYDEFQKGRHISFYTSPNLREWTFASRIEGFFECPDLFELPVDGDASRKKWVLTAASSEYRVGTFDGRVFTPETPMLPGHRGESFYAAQTYSDTPDGRRIQIGWGQMATPGMPFNQMMCFPCQLSLTQTAEGPRLRWQPITEIDNLIKRRHRVTGVHLLPNSPNPLQAIRAEASDVWMDLRVTGSAEARFTVRGTPVTYNAQSHELRVGKKTALLSPRGDRVSFRVLCDRTSLEVFAEEGLVYMPANAVRKGSVPQYTLSVSGGEADLIQAEVRELKSIWR